MSHIQRLQEQLNAALRDAGKKHAREAWMVEKSREEARELADYIIEHGAGEDCGICQRERVAQ